MVSGFKDKKIPEWFMGIFQMFCYQTVTNDLISWVIIQLTFYEKSDWLRVFNHYKILCEVHLKTQYEYLQQIMYISC